MRFTLENIIISIAAVLVEEYPDTPVYSNSNQQGTETPCFFVFFMPTKMENQIGRRFIRTIGVDIIYLTERNTPDANDLMTEIADALDCAMELISYTDGIGTHNLYTFDREWKIDDGELHYQFKIKAVVSTPDDSPAMEEIAEYQGGIKNGK